MEEAINVIIIIIIPPLVDKGKQNMDIAWLF